ncbi:hypothetical protein M758_8G132600 [Ceratodon purpureus]|nr:hypothetical protein M758_8G132600 [Ceratodon purpureus]
MAGHYFYDPRPFYGMNMSTNLLPLDELFHKYEPVPYWMDQRMASMSYPDYHPGQVKQVMTRGPEVQQFLPYNRPELAVRDDIYTDTYKRSPHFTGFGPYPEMRQTRMTQDDTYLHSMTPQYMTPQSQFPHQGIVPQRGYGAMAEMPMPMPMGYMGNVNGGQQQYMRQGEMVPTHGHMNNQNFPNQSYNGGEQMGVTSKGNKNHGSNNNNNSKSYNNDDSYGTKSNKKTSYNNNDDDYSNKTSNNNNNNNSKQGMYNDDYGYGNKTSNNNNNNNSKQGMYNDDYGYGNKTSNNNNKSKQEMYNDDYGYSNKSSSKKMYSNDDNYSNKSNNGNSNYGVGTKQSNSKQQQQRYTNDDSSSDDDEDEYGSGKGGGKWGSKPLLKHSKGDTYSHGKNYDNDMGSKKSGKGSGSYNQSYGGNTMVVYDSGKTQNGQKHGSHSKSSSKMSSYRNGEDSSSDEDDSYAYTKKASKSGQQNQGITKVQHSHGHGGKEQSTRGFDSHVQSYGQQPKHSLFQSQSKSLELKVPICCDNCEKKVTASLEYVPGVESVLCDQWQKKVIVYGNVKPDVVLKRVKKVKKGAELWQQGPKRVPVY